jgi:hypothetical protein
MKILSRNGYLVNAHISYGHIYMSSFDERHKFYLNLD